MGLKREYAGVIFTNHALDRLDERGLRQELVVKALYSPDEQYQGKKQGTTEFHKRIDNSLITIVATKNDHNQWIILSNWIDPPFPGTKDAKKQEKWRKYRDARNKAGFWGKLFLEFKRQLGF